MFHFDTTHQSGSISPISSAQASRRGPARDAAAARERAQRPQGLLRQGLGPRGAADRAYVYTCSTCSSSNSDLTITLVKRVKFVEPCESVGQCSYEIDHHVAASAQIWFKKLTTFG